MRESVCVCVREREKGGGRGGRRQTDRIIEGVIGRYKNIISDNYITSHNNVLYTPTHHA